MKNHMELSHTSRKKLKNQANATGHKGTRPHVFYLSPPFLSFLLPPPEARPLSGSSSDCCYQMAMNSFFSTSQLTISGPSDPCSGTHPREGRHAQSQRGLPT